MEQVFGVLAVVLPVLAALGLGCLARAKKLLGSAGIDGLKALVMNFCLPAVLVGAFYKAEFSPAFVVVALAMVLCCMAALGLGAAAQKWLRLPGALAPFLTTGFEAGMMGYGLYAMLFGAQNMQPFAMVDLGQVLFVFTLYMALLNRRKGVGTRETLVGMVKSPVFLAIVAGVALGATGLGRLLDAGPAGGVAAALLDYISAPTGMLMIFVVGYGLRLDRQSLKGAVATAACRVVIMAGLCALCIFAVGRLVPMTDGLFWAFILMFSLPPPFVLPVFAGGGGEDAAVSTSLSLYALLSVAAFTVISMLQ